MSSNPTVTWNGRSGREYQYHVHELPVRFDPNQEGNYIYCKLNEQRRWLPIYIGQGDLSDRTSNHHRARCIAKKGATHIHAHLNAGEADRLQEEKDLLENHPTAYEPAGCNVREGG